MGRTRALADSAAGLRFEDLPAGAVADEVWELISRLERLDHVRELTEALR
jgi:hypothetical protein